MKTCDTTPAPPRHREEVGRAEMAFKGEVFIWRRRPFVRSFGGHRYKVTHLLLRLCGGAGASELHRAAYKVAYSRITGVEPYCLFIALVQHIN